MAYIRTVKTASRATAVQIVHSNRRGSREIEHIGSAHTPEDVEVLKAVARQRLNAGQDTLDFGDGRPAGATLPILSTRSQQLWDALCLAYISLGFDAACEADEVFKALVLARLIEPASSPRSGCSRRSASRRRVTRRSTGGCPAMRLMSGGSGSRVPVRRMSGSGRPRWCSTT